MPMRLKAITMPGLAAVLAFASLAAAQPAGGRGGWGPGGADARADYLKLSEPQRAQAKELFEKQRPQLAALHQSLRDNRQKVEEALAAPTPDPTAVGELVIEGHRLQQQSKQLRDQADKALRALLTPEQQVKFDAMRALREERGPMGPLGHGRGFGPMGAGPDGPPPGPPPQQ
jgi:Spy/CpxP family protein refolding chaperone